MLGDGRGGWGVSVGLVLATGLLLACRPRASGCATTEPEAPAPGDSALGGTDGTVVADGPTSEDPKCAAQGSPWDGNPTGCTYEHGGCCYPDPASLCAAAGCSDDDCRILESRPAQAAC